MKKGKDLETEYFVSENNASAHKLRTEKDREQKKLHDEELKALHHMKCSKCGHDLITKRLNYIDVDQCTSCGALVIAHGDVDRFVGEEHSVLKTIIDFFKP